MPSTAAVTVACAVTLIVFLIVDVIWLKAFMSDFFEQRIGGIMRAEPKLGIAAAFYVIYALGAVYFAVMPGLNGGGLRLVLLNGAMLGFLAYGTFEATNMAILEGYQWPLVIVDTLWGAVLTAGSAAAGYLAASAVGGGA